MPRLPPVATTAAELQEAIALHKAGRLGEAERLYRAHLAADPAAILALTNLGQILQSRGDHAGALELYGKAATLKPRLALPQACRGRALAALGKLDGAREAFEQAIALDLSSAEALAGLAGLRQQQGDVWDAVQYWRRAAEAAPARSDIRQNLALALSEAGNPEMAATIMQAVTKELPDSAIAHANLAAILTRAGRFSEAASVALRATELAPGDAGAHYNLAMALIGGGDHAAGVANLQRTLAIEPGHVDALNVLGMHHRRQAENGQALACFRRAAAADPRHLGILLNIGATLLEDGRPEEALATYRQALRINPRKAEILVNLGSTLEQMERFEEALAAYRLAIAAEPENAVAHFNHGLALLSLGRFREAWPDYEWRHRAFPPAASRQSTGPNRWKGEPLKGRSILVHAEQGIGDTIQFCRYLPVLRQAGARVTFDCPPGLERLLGRANLADRVITRHDALPGGDFHIPLLSLPALLGSEIATIPNAVPYLEADAGEIEAHRRLFAGLSRPLIGIAWQGSPGHKADRRRSIPLPMLLGALAPLGMSLVSLQVGHGREQIEAMPPVLRPFDPFADQPAPDFATTAAVVGAVDLVISIDSAVAHLAGAMGRPVFVLLPRAGDWRWLHEREDSPWYPTMRLFRQHRLGDWSYAFARLAQALQAWR